MVSPTQCTPCAQYERMYFSFTVHESVHVIDAWCMFLSYHIIGEQEQANQVVSTGRFFYMYVPGTAWSQAERRRKLCDKQEQQRCPKEREARRLLQL